ncbi:MAG: aldehyde ferredoxin oxidoreductase [Deltaproteobacteria bacterium]|jgi:aldehyde:ferredoxin oxidoreductase|nr:aldehyde ferredoxin oxidoreductase [Deltaproteobacteria bacterium]
MAKILRVDMASGDCRFTEVPSLYLGLGGRGLTSAIVANEVDPLANPLGPRNKLVFAPGLLGGTSCANSGRISAGAKSPLTLGIKESNSGGQPGGHLASLGILAVVIENAATPDGWWQLEISPDFARLTPCSAGGLNNYVAVEKLSAEQSPGCSYITIGRAGEFRLAASSIAMTDLEGLPSRQAARGGLGAVMGSKRLKAVIIHPGKEILPLVDPDSFHKASKRFAKALTEHPVCGRSLSEYGSAAMMGLFNEAGAVPTRNFSNNRFDHADALSGERLNELTRQRGGQGRVARACMSGCVMRCSGVFPDSLGRRIGKWPDYETMWAFGPNAEIKDLDDVARYDRLCDDTGVDTIDVGGALAVLMEAGALKFGDAKGALAAAAEISEGTALGRILGSGAAVAGKVYGAIRVAEVKGQALPAFDPRSVKGQGVTFATNPQGADHTAGFSYAANLLAMGGEVDPLSAEGQAELSRRTQISAAAVDSLGLCLFVSFAFFETPEAVDAVVDMLNARYGWSLTRRDLDLLGRRVLEIEVDFNRRAGLSSSSDRLPEFFAYEETIVHKSTFDVTQSDLDKVLSFKEELK